MLLEINFGSCKHRGFPSNFNSQATGLNNKGEIVGFFQTTKDLSSSLGFLDDDGTITTIDPFGSTFTQALGINDLGEIVGFYTDSMGDRHGYIDNDGVSTSFDPAGSIGTTINGVNDLGDIVGFYATAIGFVGTPVPGPSTWAMMLLGFAGLGYAAYRKTKTERMAFA